MRIRGVKTELESAGEDTEGMVENTAKLQEKIMALTDVDGSGGIDILTDSGDFKSTYDILLEISKVWSKISDKSQASLLETLAGKTRGSVVAGLLQSGDVLEEAYEAVGESSGSSLKELETYMDSIEGKTKQLTNEIQTLWNDTLNSGVIKWFLDAALGVTKLVNSIGPLGTALAGILVYFTAFKKQSPATLFGDMFASIQNRHQALIKVSTFKNIGLDVGTAGNWNTEAINTYAAAISGLTAKKQAEILATNGLNQAQITEIMTRNNVDAATIKETLSTVKLTAQKTKLHTATVQEALATQMGSKSMQDQVAANFLAANGSKKLTAELLEQAVTQGVLTRAQAASIASNYKLSSSWTTLGKSIVGAFKANPVGMTLTIVSIGATIVSSIIQARKEAIRAANEAIDKYKETKKTLEDQKKTIDELSSAYKKLSKGVNTNTNQNISLATDSYEEYLQVCNDIADMYPDLVVGYDKQGNAILSLKGQVDELTQSYNDAASAARQEAITKGSKVVSDFRNKYIGAEWTQYGDVNRDWMWGSATLREWANSNSARIKAIYNQANESASQVKALMDAYVKEDLDYAALSDESKLYVDEIISSLDSAFLSLNKFKSADALYDWIKTNIVDAFKDPAIADAINSISDLHLKFSTEDMEYEDYHTQVNEYLDQLATKLDPEAYDQISDIFGIEENIKNSITRVRNILEDGQQYMVSTLNKEDLLVAANLEVPEGVTYTWVELLDKIEEAKIAATEDFDVSNFTDAVSAHSQAITEYQEALQKLDKGSFTMDDFMELIKKYPELAKGVDISSNAFLGLSRNLKGAVKTSTKSFVKELKELKAGLVAAGKSTESIDQLIEAIENMPTDALDSTIQKYGTLADKIDSARRSQDKLLASMEENPNEGYETRGEAMEYMKEAMQNGEIGSESNLWNVAEKYGFTYDSAKTINENADALAKFIATRERWFKEDDDGDDRTQDGYSYEGTENFIKDVEAAVQSSEELQKYLTWDYDESAGTLSFDYDNKDWDTIVSILSETKQLAGLTSDEFSDLLTQVGQYFGIDWSNYDDVLDHLVGIATSSSDAKTKVEEYGKSMQDYFGDNSDVDLTARPTVKFDSTNFKEWEEYYQNIVDNSNDYSKEYVENAEEQLRDIQMGNSYATVYSSTFSNEDGTKSVVVTPILPDGSVLSPAQLEAYANKLLKGEDLDPGIDIKLAEFDGTNSQQQADGFAEALHEAQSYYNILKDPLKINSIIDTEGIEGLSDVAEIQSAIITKADGTFVIDEDAFKEALSGAQYTEDQIDILIDKIKQVEQEAFNIDPFNIDETLMNEGIDGLTQIEKLQGSLTTHSQTGLTILDTDIFTSVLKAAGYTEEQISSLIEKIQDFNTVISVQGNTDPLGLNNVERSADSLKASLGALGVSYDQFADWRGWIFGDDSTVDLKINVTDLVTVLKEKGWTDTAIKEYITTLSSTEFEGITVDVKGIENIDEVIKTASAVPEEEQTEYTVTGTGETALQNIASMWGTIEADKTTDYTITETTIKKTKTENEGFKWSSWSPWYANGTAHAQGSWGAPKTETALVGELGPELLVRGNKWFTVGENGAEFTQVKKGDIIFNHKQSKDLLENGYVTSRGKAYASGTAYATANGTFARYEFSGTGGWQQYDVNDKVVESWGDLSGAVSDASESASDAAEDFAETLDWVAIRIEEITDDIDLKTAKLENTVNLTSKNKTIDDIIDLSKSLYNNLIAGANKYYAQAKTYLAKVPKEYRDAAQDGSIALTEFAGEVGEEAYNAIEDYRDWVQKGDDLTKQAEETLTDISTWAKQKFDNIEKAYQNKSSLNESKQDQLDASNEYMETTYGFESEAIYRQKIKTNNKDIETKKAQRNKMQADLDASVKSGNIKKYSDEWYDAVNAISAVDTEIINLQTDNKNYQDSINNLHWEKFDLLMSKYEAVSDEADNLLDILSNEDMVDESGNWTDAGTASLGLYAQQMENAEMQAKQYQSQINYLNKNWKALGYTEEEYIEKLGELKDGQAGAIKSYNDSKDAIVDLNKERIDAIKNGIQEEIDAYDELIEKKKEELDAEKDLHDFQKSVADQQKDIASIERKLAALAGDNSASARAKRAQLEAELAEAKSGLEETYYDRSINNKKNALDDEKEAFTEGKEKEMEDLDEYLENPDQVVADSINTVQTNANNVLQTINKTAKEYGLQLSETLVDPWKAGASAIQDYSTKFGLSSSATVDELNEIKSEHADLLDKLKERGNNSVNSANERANKYVSAEKETPKPTSPQNPSGNSDKPTNKDKAAPTVGSTVTVKKSATNFSSKSGNAKMASFVPGGSYTVYEVSGDQILIGQDGTYTGWVKQSDLQGYAKGTTSLKKSGLINVDELGEELILGAHNGRLTYAEKGTGIIPADITSNLMSWGELDPRDMLDYNRPSIGISPDVHNTEVNLNITYGDMVSIGEFRGDNLAELEKMVAKQFEKHTKDLNSALRKYVR